MMKPLCTGVLVATVFAASCAPKLDEGTFATADEAVKSLIETTKAGNIDAIVTLFGPEGRELVASSDPATARANQETFLAAAAQRWRLEDRDATTKELIVGNEDWPFPIPIVKTEGGWRFDAAAGKEEVLARRIGRNELAVIDVCRSYVRAQRAYARARHDGQPAGRYAQRFNSEPGRQNGLYWPSAPGRPRSPFGDLVAAAAGDGYDLAARKAPAPFYGYQFRILTAQGAAARGGAKDYVKNGAMSEGFALIAWPAQYDATGVMTFMVSNDGVVYEQDLGPETAKAAAAITRYDPDNTWRPVEAKSASKP